MAEQQQLALEEQQKQTIYLERISKTIPFNKWLKQNSLINAPVNNRITQSQLVFKSKGRQQLSHMTWNLQVTGAPYTDPNQVLQASPDGILQTLIGWALVLKPYNEPLGEMSLNTLAQTNATDAPIYSIVNNVVDGGFYLLNGPMFDIQYKSSFMDSQYPGPLSFEDGDELYLVYVGSDNLNNWNQSVSKPYGRITGTVTWQSNQISANSNPIAV